jgi:hypothetical protein
MIATAHPPVQPVTLSDCIAMLEARRQWLAEQLNEFAKPIAACDADYNAILAERAEIVRAISCLNPIARGEARVPHPREDH